jgi:general secretion pathway protein G
MRKALLIQWVFLAVPFIALLIAVTFDLGLLVLLFDLAFFAMAIVWIAIVAVFRRKYHLSYKFPLALIAASFLAGFLTPSCYICGAARGRIEMFVVALERYKHDVGSYPTTEQGLQALRFKPDGVDRWNGPYLEGDIPNDPWGHPYIYKFPGKTPSKPEIISYGADGVPGGRGANADIVSE